MKTESFGFRYDVWLMLSKLGAGGQSSSLWFWNEIVDFTRMKGEEMFE